MKYLTLFFFISSLIFDSTNVMSNQSNSNLCHIRGYEIIFPYEQAVYKIKKGFRNLPEVKKLELIKFKKRFENDFYGIPLYKAAGCSNARLSEYLNCLVSTDGKDCKIYYTQMRIVD